MHPRPNTGTPSPDGQETHTRGEKADEAKKVHHGNCTPAHRRTPTRTHTHTCTGSEVRADLVARHPIRQRDAELKDT